MAAPAGGMGDATADDEALSDPREAERIAREAIEHALAIAPGQLDAAALWCAGMLARTRERELRNLVGRNAPTREVQS